MIPGASFTPLALADLEEHALYLEEQTEGAGFRFLDAAERTVRGLLDMPGKGRSREFQNPRLHGIRSWRVSGFEHWLVFYRTTESTLEVVRILHGARDLLSILEDDEPLSNA